MLRQSGFAPMLYPPLITQKAPDFSDAFSDAFSDKDDASDEAEDASVAAVEASVAAVEVSDDVDEADSAESSIEASSAGSNASNILSKSEAAKAELASKAASLSAFLPHPVSMAREMIMTATNRFFIKSPNYLFPAFLSQTSRSVPTTLEVKGVPSFFSKCSWASFTYLKPMYKRGILQ